MKNNKSHGEDRITAEMLKIGREQLSESIRTLLNKCLNIEKQPRHGKVQNCTETGTEITQKTINQLAYLQSKLEFRGFSTIDHLQTVHTLFLENTMEYKISLHLALIDHQKVFEPIEPHAGLNALDSARINSRYSTLIKHIYKKLTCRIQKFRGYL